MSGAITLTIDTLALPGLTEAEGGRAARAFEAALTEALMRDGLPRGATAADLARVSLDSLPVAAGTPEAMGRALARALLRRLSP